MKKFLLTAIALFIGACAFAQDASSSSSVVRRKASDRNTRQDSPGVTQRMQNRLESSSTDDSELQWMRVMYRSLDLTKDANGALYYPDEPVEGQDNLFRIIMKRMADGSLQGYEYLDGREVFSDDFKVNMRDVLDRFYILYSEAKGSTEKNPRFTIEESDIPASEVLSYYIIERWEFDRRSNRMRTLVEAICPVLHSPDDFGSVRTFPICWIRMDDLKPYLQSQYVFTDDDNNLPRYTYDDFFTLNLYKGNIYKTRNLRNRSMAQLYPDPDDLKRAQDSIQNRLDHYADNLWVPSREEILAARQAAEAAAAAADSTGAVAEVAAPVRKKAKSTRTSSRSRVKVKKEPKKAKSSGGSSSATRSVRNRRR